MIKPVIFLFFSIITTNVTANNIDKVMPVEHTRIFGLSMNHSNLKDIFSLFGKTEAWKRKDQHHDPFFYCYKLNSKPSSVWIVFGLGWGTDFKKLDSIQVTTNKSDISGSCKLSNVSAEKISTQSGIHLGLKKTNALKLIKDKPTKSDGKISYTYEWYEKYTEPKIYPSSDFIYIGEWHYGYIVYGIIDDILVNYNISVGGEAHFIPKDELK